MNLDHVYVAGSLVAIRRVPRTGGAPFVRYQHTDALGSPVAGTDEVGALVVRTTYEPYGLALNRAVDGVGYGGHVMDAATGLVYMQQRYYDPGIGRFLSTDPVAADANTGASFNRYAYANDNPYKYVDPDGMSAECSTNSKTGATTCTISTTGSHIQQRITLTAVQVRNIVFNESRSLSGANIGEARSKIANLVINRFKAQACSSSGEIRVGNGIDTASDALPKRISSAEQKTLQSIGETVSNVVGDRARSIDSTRGAISYNFRDINRYRVTGYRGLSTQMRNGLAPIPGLIQGPFDNSAPSRDLGPTGIYLVPYAEPEL